MLVKNIQIEDIYNNPDLYDNEYGEFKEDIEYWLKIASKYNVKSLLELGCGTGRLGCRLTPLLKEYVGIDLSLPFLNHFRSKIADLLHKSKVQYGDITNFCFDRKFDAIIIPFNVIAHIYDYESMQNLINCVKAHMHKDSIFCIDCFNPNVRILSGNNKFEKVYDFFWFEVQYTLFQKNYYSTATQINYIKNKYYNNINKKSIVVDLPMRMFYPLELDALLLLNNFIIKEKFGDYNMSDFNDKSDKQLLVTCMDN